MKTIKMLAAAAALALASAPAAHAAQVLATAPGLAAYPQLQVLYCDIVNVDKVQRNVTIDIMDYFGNVILGPLTQPLPPNNGTALGDGSGNGAWCRFTVDGSAKKFRAMAIYDNGSAYTTSVQAQ
jgi:hypothetical protein